MDNTARSIGHPMHTFRRGKPTLLLRQATGEEPDRTLATRRKQGANQKSVTPGPETQESILLQERLVRGYNAFGIEIFGKLAAKDAGKNIFISPTSIASALTMTLNGAEGSTLQGMAATLHADGLSLKQINEANAGVLRALSGKDPKVTLEVANALWASPKVTLREEFVKRNKQYLQAEVGTLDFEQSSAASAHINRWVGDKTHKKIQKLVEPSNFNADTSVVLVNATYFKGPWSREFDKKLTHENDTFNLAPGKTKKIAMMHQSGRYRYFENEQVQAVDLPYGNGKLSMVVVLPKESTTLAQVQKRLDPKTWDHWTQNLRFREGSIALPRFKAEYEAELNAPLASLGMAEAFSPRANFDAAIDPSRSFADAFHIDKVLHKAVLEVNEEGSEAAGATAVIVVRTTSVGPRDYFNMRVDRPFLCAIRDNETGTVLFMGSVVDPK